MEDKRNIIDHYKYWTHHAILADLDSRRHSFAVLLSNLGSDFNIGTCIRNCNAFLGSFVYIYGRRRFDRRGTVGTHRYERFRYVSEIEEISPLLKEYVFVGIDNIEGALPMEDFQWPANSLMCFGQEDIGLPDEVKELCTSLVYIKQYGSVRSLNVGSASAIAMYDWCRKNVTVP